MAVGPWRSSDLHGPTFHVHSLRWPRGDQTLVWSTRMSAGEASCRGQRTSGLRSAGASSGAIYPRSDTASGAVNHYAPLPGHHHAPRSRHNRPAQLGRNMAPQRECHASHTRYCRMKAHMTGILHASSMLTLALLRRAAGLLVHRSWPSRRDVAPVGHRAGSAQPRPLSLPAPGDPPPPVGQSSRGSGVHRRTPGAAEGTHEHPGHGLP